MKNNNILFDVFLDFRDNLRANQTNSLHYIHFGFIFVKRHLQF